MVGLKEEVAKLNPSELSGGMAQTRQPGARVGHQPEMYFV